MDDKKQLTDAEAAQALITILKNRDSVENKSSSMGSCSFTLGSTSSCLNMTKSECDFMKGNWSSTGKCSLNHPENGSTCKSK